MIYKQKKKEYSSGNNVLEVIQQSKQRSDEEIVRLNQELEAKKSKKVSIKELEDYEKELQREVAEIQKKYLIHLIL